jgi:hypothetical protein
LIDALFCFGSQNAGHTFLIFASVTDTSANGVVSTRTSRNLSAPSGTCPLGNEQGIQVTFKCTAATTTTANNPEIDSCSVTRDSSGRFLLNIVGKNLDPNGGLTVAGVAPKKLKFPGLQSGSTATNAVAIGKFCAHLPGDLVWTNGDGTKSAPFTCNQTCQ